MNISKHAEEEGGQCMGEKVSPVTIITKTGHIVVHSGEPAKCEECGAIEELRPYGKGGKYVCFDCAMKDEEEAKRQFKKQFEQ